MRVAPRSLTRAVAVSAMISATVAASEATGQVQGMSPTVRKRTRRVVGTSPDRGGVSGVTGAVESEAKTHPEVIQETLLTTTSERQGRVIDKDAGGAGMEDRKKEGYF